jgi:hypothetical protein
LIYDVVENVDLSLAEPVTTVFELVGSHAGLVEESIYIDFWMIFIKIFYVVLDKPAVV